VDEVHLAKAKSLTHLMEKAVETPFRFGFTGSLDDSQAHQLILEGLFGPVTRVATTKQLQQRKELAKLHINMLVLKYPETTCKQLRKAQYQDEIEFIVTDVGAAGVRCPACQKPEGERPVPVQLRREARQAALRTHEARLHGQAGALHCRRSGR
jgi:superfamily II DNA or RNA helicase